MKYNVNPSFGEDMSETLRTMDIVLSMSTLTTRNSVRSAVLLYPGILDTDLRRTIREFASVIETSSYSFVMIAGHHEAANQRLALTSDALRYVFNGGSEIITQIMAENTPEQSEWVAEMLIKHEIDKVELYTPAFHLPRAYLTLLRSLIKVDISSNVVLLPRILAQNPIARVRITKPYSDELSQYELIPGEAGRISQYTKKGDVATMEELQHYVGLHF